MGSFNFKEAPHYKESSLQFIGQHSQTILPISVLQGQKKLDIKSIDLDNKICRINGKLPFPLSAIGLLRVRHPLSDKVIDGTCVLVSPRVLLTCAHNIYCYEQKMFYKELDYFPSVNGPLNRKINIKINSSTVKIHPHFHQYETTQHEYFDFGVIYLPQDMDQLCGCVQIAANHRKDTEIYLFGYPVEDNSNQYEAHLFGGKGRVTKSNQSLLFYNLETKAGQSGAPILVESQEGWKVIGIHTVSDPSGVYINHQVAQTLNSWIKGTQSTLAINDGDKIFGQKGPKLQKMVTKYEWQSLVGLTLVNCNITSANLMNLNSISWNIKIMVLDRNKIDKICLNPTKFIRLQKLSLNNNLITNIEDHINNFKRLTFLSLEKNRIGKLNFTITLKQLKIFIKGNNCEFGDKIDKRYFQF